MVSRLVVCFALACFEVNSDAIAICILVQNHAALVQLELNAAHYCILPYIYYIGPYQLNWCFLE
jgi:hypothetical protein